MEGVEKSSRVFITDKHPGHYRPDEVCEIIGMEMVWPQGGYDPRLCYRVRYRDGYEDFIAIDRSTYKIKTEEEMIEEIKKTEETFMDRLVREQNELIEKINKLRGFIDSEGFARIAPMQQPLLRIQLGIMIGYRDILTERMALLVQE